jgi:hypothetical protein
MNHGYGKKGIEAGGEPFPTYDQAAVLPLEPGKRPLGLVAGHVLFDRPPVRPENPNRLNFLTFISAMITLEQWAFPYPFTSHDEASDHATRHLDPVRILRNMVPLPGISANRLYGFGRFNLRTVVTSSFVARTAPGEIRASGDSAACTTLSAPVSG